MGGILHHGNEGKCPQRRVFRSLGNKAAQTLQQDESRVHAALKEKRKPLAAGLAVNWPPAVGASNVMGQTDVVPGGCTCRLPYSTDHQPSLSTLSCRITHADAAASDGSTPEKSQADPCGSRTPGRLGRSSHSGPEHSRAPRGKPAAHRRGRLQTEG